MRILFSLILFLAAFAEASVPEAKQAVLDRYDILVKDLARQHPLEDGDSKRLLAYLYNSQKALLDSTQDFSGNLQPICICVIRLFYPGFSPDVPEGSNPLIKKVSTRFKDERFKICLSGQKTLHA